MRRYVNLVSMCKVYIKPEDVYEKLSDEDKKKYNRVIFTSSHIGDDGCVHIDCIFADSMSETEKMNCRYRIFKNEE